MKILPQIAMHRKLITFATCFVLATIAATLTFRSKVLEQSAKTSQEKAKPTHQPSGTPTDNHDYLNHKNTEQMTPVSQLPLKLQNLIHLKPTPSEAKILLDRCEKELKDITARSVLSATIIASLCKQGLDETAWNLISSEPGAVRAREISFYFTYSEAESPDKIAKKISDLTDTVDRDQAMSGLIMGHPEVAMQMDSSIVPGSTSQGKHLFEQSVSIVLKKEDVTQETKNRLIERSMQLVATGNIPPEYLAYILGNAYPNDSFAQWELVNTHRETFDKKTIESLNAGMAKPMIDADASKTMNLLVSDPETKYSYPVMSSAVSRMFENSPNSANAWLSENLDHIDPATAQRIIAVTAQTANRNFEFETSRKWANRILNTELRQQLLKQVDDVEASQSKQTPK